MGWWRRTRTLAVALVGWIVGTSASATVVLEAYVGGREYTTPLADGGQRVYHANALSGVLGYELLDWPLTLGASYTLFDHQESDWGVVDPSGRVAAHEVGAELTLGLPLFDSLTLVLRGRYTIDAAVVIRDRFALGGEVAAIEGEFAVEGGHVGLGLMLTLIDGLPLRVEVIQGRQTLQLVDLTENGSRSWVMPSSNEPVAYDSRGFLVGFGLHLTGD